VRSWRASGERHARQRILSLNQARGARKPGCETLAHARTTGRAGAIERLDLVEQKLDLGGDF